MSIDWPHIYSPICAACCCRCHIPHGHGVCCAAKYAIKISAKNVQHMQMRVCVCVRPFNGRTNEFSMKMTLVTHMAKSHLQWLTRGEWSSRWGGGSTSKVPLQLTLTSFALPDCAWEMQSICKFYACVCVCAAASCKVRGQLWLEGDMSISLN